MQTICNMSNKWDEFQITPSKKFGDEVEIYTPSIYREYRGEIFTTLHTEEHPVMMKLPIMPIASDGLSSSGEYWFSASVLFQLSISSCDTPSWILGGGSTGVVGTVCNSNIV